MTLFVSWLDEFMLWLASLFGPSHVVSVSTPYGVSMSIPLRTSESGVSFIKYEEGFRERAYKDIYGNWTIAYGHKIIPGDGFSVSSLVSQVQADALLRHDLIERENTVKNLVKVPISQNQFNALVSFVYNIGAGNFQKSTALAAINAGDFDRARRAIANYGSASGQTALTPRRLREAALFGGNSAAGIA